MTAFELWHIEAIGYCLGTETTATSSKKKGRDTQNQDEELPRAGGDCTTWRNGGLKPRRGGHSILISTQQVTDVAMLLVAFYAHFKRQQKERGGIVFGIQLRVTY